MKLKSIISKMAEYYRTRWYASLIILFSVLMILMLFEVKNHRFRASDFKVYHRAAGRLIQGENLYRPDIDGHYYYKYSPTAAVYFVPSAMLPVNLAKVLHWIVMALMTCLGFYLALRMVRPEFRTDEPRHINNLLLLLGLILGVHLENEFFLGQVNQILLVLYLLMVFLASRNKDLPASIIWAGTIFIKPFGFIFLPYYLVKKRFKLVLLFCLFTVILIFAPLPFTGIANFAGQYRHWFHELSVEMAWKQSLLAPGNDTIFAILARYTPLHFIDFTPQVVRIFQLIVIALVGSLFLYLMYRGRDLKDSWVLEIACLIALIPMLSFTNHYAFQFIGPAAFLIVFNYRSFSKWWQIAVVVGLILTAMNMHDVWGADIYKFLNEISLVAIGAIIVQAALVKLRLKSAA